MKRELSHMNAPSPYRPLVSSGLCFRSPTVAIDQVNDFRPVGAAFRITAIVKGLENTIPSNLLVGGLNEQDWTMSKSIV